MTPFQEQVREAVDRATSGPPRIASYGDFAELVGQQRGSAGQAVGEAIKHLTAELGDAFPWWRVVSSDGTMVAPDPVDQLRRLLANFVAGVTAGKSKVLFRSKTVAFDWGSNNFEKV